MSGYLPSDAPAPPPSSTPRAGIAVRSTAERNALVEQHYKLIRWYLDRWRLANHHHADEIISALHLALIRTAETWQPAKGSFASWFVWWTRSILPHDLCHASLIRLPRRSSAELAELRKRFTPRSLSARSREGDALLDAPDPAPTAEEVLTERDSLDHRRHQMRNFLHRLPAHCRQCVEMRFFEGLTFEACGERLGVTRERARQLVCQSLEKMRRMAGRSRAG